MPPSSKQQRILLTEGTPALVTNLPAMALKEDQSPAVRGISSTAEGFLQRGTIPTADTTVLKQYTIGDDTYDWYFNRLWRIDNGEEEDTPKLIYGAPEYTATYYRQGKGEVEFRDTTTNILNVQPFGNGNIAVFKSDGGYVINGAISPQDRFQRSDFMQEMLISTGTHAVELDEVMYFINTQGFFSLEGNGNITELSFLQKGATAITASALTVNYLTKQIIIGTTAVYDTITKRFYDYSGAFTYTSRQLTGNDNEQFFTTQITFEYDLTDTALGQIKLETKVEDRGWSQTEEIAIRQEDRVGSQFYSHMLRTQDTGKGFQLRISELSTNVKIKRIFAVVQGLNPMSRES